MAFSFIDTHKFSGSPFLWLVGVPVNRTMLIAPPSAAWPAKWPSMQSIISTRLLNCIGLSNNLSSATRNQPPVVIGVINHTPLHLMAQPIFIHLTGHLSSPYDTRLTTRVLWQTVSKALLSKYTTLTALHLPTGRVIYLISAGNQAGQA